MAQQSQVARIRAVAVDVIDLGAGGVAQDAQAAVAFDDGLSGSRGK
jgi:hypothetical protein